MNDPGIYSVNRGNLKGTERSSRLTVLERLRRLFTCTKRHPDVSTKSIVQRDGNYRLLITGLSDVQRKYLSDLYITLIDAQWRFVIIILFGTFAVTYLVFGFFWWFMAYNNKDFENLNNGNHTFCLIGIKNFAMSLMFSIETQTSVGYGYAWPNAHCFGTIPLMYLQIVIGFFLETVLLGFIFMKISRPKYRSRTLVWSRYAVICQENGGLCLQVRLGDIRQTHLVSAHVTGMMIGRHRTKEGAIYPMYQHQLHFQTHNMGNKAFLLWPLVLTHRITEESPLWDTKPRERTKAKFELVLFVEGILEATGEVCQARTAFTQDDILWGRRFECMERYDPNRKRWQVDFTKLNSVRHCQDIRHSAREFSAYLEANIARGSDSERATAVCHQTFSERRVSWSLFDKTQSDKKRVSDVSASASVTASASAEKKEEESDVHDVGAVENVSDGDEQDRESSSNRPKSTHGKRKLSTVHTE